MCRFKNNNHPHNVPVWFINLYFVAIPHNIPHNQIILSQNTNTILYTKPRPTLHRLTELAQRHAKNCTQHDLSILHVGNAISLACPCTGTDRHGPKSELPRAELSHFNTLNYKFIYQNHDIISSITYNSRCTQCQQIMKLASLFSSLKNMFQNHIQSLAEIMFTFSHGNILSLLRDNIF